MRIGDIEDIRKFLQNLVYLLAKKKISMQITEGHENKVELSVLVDGNLVCINDFDGLNFYLYEGSTINASRPMIERTYLRPSFADQWQHSYIATSTFNMWQDEYWLLGWIIKFCQNKLEERGIEAVIREFERERKVEALIKSLEQMATATAPTSDAARFRSLLNDAAQTIESWGRMVRKGLKGGAAPKEVVAKLLDGFDYKAQEILDALDETTPSKTGAVIM